jgi:ABC-type uncharacterized transport system substrate-binding protein
MFKRPVRKQGIFATLSTTGLLFLSLLLCPVTQADILLLLSSDASYYLETASSLQDTVNKALPESPGFSTINLQKTKLSDHRGPSYQLIVAIGSYATREVVNWGGETPVLSIFTPKNAYESAWSAHDKATARPASAIFLDQPLSRVITLASLLKPQATRFSTIFGPASRGLEAELKTLTAARGLILKHGYLDKEDNPVSVLRPVVSGTDLFIALPDQAVLNRAIAKWILHLSFQQKVPVIGFSKAYTVAGALASIFSSPDDIGRQAGEQISQWLRNPASTLGEPQYPRYFSITTNPAIARSLGISLPADNTLYMGIQRQEQAAQ